MYMYMYYKIYNNNTNLLLTLTFSGFLKPLTKNQKENNDHTLSKYRTCMCIILVIIHVYYKLLHIYSIHVHVHVFHTKIEAWPYFNSTNAQSLP